MTLLTVRAAAERLGISTGTLYALCATRKIRHERHGLGRGRIKIPEDAIEEYRRRVTVSPRITAQPRDATPEPARVKLRHLSMD